MERMNFHTHTMLCKHATGEPEDYCREALNQGISVLGFSDHTPYPGDDHWFAVRMSLCQLPDYVAQIRAAQKKYRGMLSVFLGMECEYDPDYLAFQRDVLLNEWQLDYICLAIHSYRYKGEWCNSFSKDTMSDAQLNAYTDWIIRGIESGIYSYVAHPSVFGVCYRGWNDNAAACSRAICQAAAAQNLPMELNANGFRKPPIQELDGRMRQQYPHPKFWEIAQENGICALVNSDAHNPKDVWGNSDQCVEFAEKLGLKIVNRQFAEQLACAYPFY